MSRELFIGIDPGKSGGIAFVGKGYAHAVPMPTSMRDILDLLDWELHLPEKHRVRFAYLEKAQAMPRDGRASIAKYMTHYGHLEMALTATDIPFDRVVSGVWQRGMQCLSGGDKKITKARAQELFPKLKITHKIADALLIAEYCRRRNGG